MYSINDKVRIKKNGMIGDVIDIYKVGKTTVYIVEGGENDRYEGAYPDADSPFPLFDCTDDELEYAWMKQKSEYINMKKIKTNIREKSTIKGLRTQESDKFYRFFELIQQEAEKKGCIFFAEAGDGHDYVSNTLECEDMMGWLIPKEKINEFEPLWEKDQVPELWSDFFTFAVWKEDGDSIKIVFEV